MTTTINHHLDDATLMAFSAGSLGEALSAVAAAHIEMCPRCQRELRGMDVMGSLLFDTQTVDASPRPPSELRAVAADLIGGDVVELQSRNGGAADGGTAETPPVAVARKYGLDLQNVAWRRLGPGVWNYRLPLSDGAKGDLRLLKIAAGRRMPEHGHGGTELTLVLDGAYHDEAGVYRAGDLQDVDGDSEHRPIADKELGCICIVASERPAVFKGIVNKLLQPLTGM